MNNTLITSVTDGQKKQYKRFVEDAADKALVEAGLDKEMIQKLIERGDEFQARIVADIREFSARNQFADEEMKSSYGYLSGYQPKRITEQCIALHKHFPGIPLRVDEDVKGLTLFSGAEAWFAIPKWEKIADTYCEAVQKVLDLIRQVRNGKFCNYCEGQLGPQYFRQHERTAAFLKRISEAQRDHDILVIPAQFGFRHRGRSVRRAREVMNVSEFGLGVFAVGIMLLTHPERLQHYDDLWIDCPGDEYSFEASGHFGHAPCFFFHDGCVRFDALGVGGAYADCGSASAFWQ
jgi:hypothetical protein